MGFIIRLAVIVSPSLVLTLVETDVYPTFCAVIVNSPTPVPPIKKVPKIESLNTEEVEGFVDRTDIGIGFPVDASIIFPEIEVFFTERNESSFTPLVGPEEESAQEESKTKITIEK